MSLSLFVLLPDFYLPFSSLCYLLASFFHEITRMTGTDFLVQSVNFGFSVAFLYWWLFMLCPKSAQIACHSRTHSARNNHNSHNNLHALELFFYLNLTYCSTIMLPPNSSNQIKQWHIDKSTNILIAILTSRSPTSLSYKLYHHIEILNNLNQMPSKP